MCDRMKIPLGKILADHGPYAPYGMFDFEYRISLPQSKKILKAQDGKDKGEYKLTDLHLEYEIIESEDLVREGQHNVGRSLGPPPGVRDHRERGSRKGRPIQRRKVFGLRLHDLAENFELGQGLHAGSHRREHPEKKYEGHRFAFHEGRRGG